MITYTIKPLKWKENPYKLPNKPTEESWIAKTLFGSYEIYINHTHNFTFITPGKYYEFEGHMPQSGVGELDECMRACTQDYENRMKDMLDEVEDTQININSKVTQNITNF